MNEELNVKTELLPMLAMRGISAFPGMILNFEAERPMSLAALDAALLSDRLVFLLAQRDPREDDPDEDGLYEIGTVCTVRQVLRMHDGMRVMVEGLCRARLCAIKSRAPFLRAELERLEERESAPTGRTEALLRRSCALFARYQELAGTGEADNAEPLSASGSMAAVSDRITQSVRLRFREKQSLLEELSAMKRLSRVNKILEREIEALEIERQLREKTQERMMRRQRETLLREQLRTIRAELGENEGNAEFDEYGAAISALRAPEEVRQKLFKELSRLEKQPFGSAEASVIRGYLDTCLELPWSKTTKERADVAAARRVLDADHYGLEKVKERIIEYIAVRQLAPDVKGTILCLVGPPGTGKTSVAASIARATNRKLVRISLGGVHDEAEIRGHRKTYVGAMPGRIIAAVAQAGTKNPLMLLDEIDKLGGDYKGDPASALLEALDFEQNFSFRDHYLELPFDLSNVLFITTANTTDTIPRPLLDRMEVIELSSYTDEEKLHIAKGHLLPKQRKKHGLTASQLKISDDAIRETIARYTRESGVRLLERELARLCRRTAVELTDSGAKRVTVTAGTLEKYLGTPRYKPESRPTRGEVGLACGLAWTSVGGEILNVEAGVMEGSGKLELTGNLGDVMKESARAAETYIRSRAAALGVAPDFYRTKDIHLHFPEGAVPKDGPSAGITIAVALISALTGVPVRRDVAMTGEITLRGRILPIGGLKEKTMAAYRNGIKTVIIPLDNEPDLQDIDKTVRGALNFVEADSLDGVLGVALERDPRAERPAEPEEMPEAAVVTAANVSPEAGIQ